jgi:hypothetical protein
VVVVVVMFVVVVMVVMFVFAVFVLFGGRDGSGGGFALRLGALVLVAEADFVFQALEDYPDREEGEVRCEGDDEPAGYGCRVLCQ